MGKILQQRIIAKNNSGKNFTINYLDHLKITDKGRETYF